MITLIRCKSVLTSFISKFFQYKENTSRNILSQFSNLCENNVTEYKQFKYRSHLHNLVEDMHIRFADLINLTVSRWIIPPFPADPENRKLELQEQFIYLQNDEESKMSFIEDRYDIFGARYLANTRSYGTK